MLSYLLETVFRSKLVFNLVTVFHSSLLRSGKMLSFQLRLAFGFRHDLLLILFFKLTFNKQRRVAFINFVCYEIISGKDLFDPFSYCIDIRLRKLINSARRTTRAN